MVSGSISRMARPMLNVRLTKMTFPAGFSKKI